MVNFTPGTTDLVPGAALTAILAPALANDGGPTMTHALVAGSPATHRIPAASCATTTDQRGLPRPQDTDGDTVADCDIGAFEFAGTPPFTQADLSLTKADSPESRDYLTYTLAVTNNGPASITIRLNTIRPRWRALPPSSPLSQGREPDISLPCPPFLV